MSKRARVCPIEETIAKLKYSSQILPAKRKNNDHCFVVAFGLAICRRNVPWPLGASRRTADAELTNVRLYGEWTP